MTRGVRPLAPRRACVSSAFDTCAVAIGKAKPCPAVRVAPRSVIGAERIVDRLSGEQLSRIC